MTEPSLALRILKLANRVIDHDGEIAVGETECATIGDYSLFRVDTKFIDAALADCSNVRVVVRLLDDDRCADKAVIGGDIARDGSLSGQWWSTLDDGELLKHHLRHLLLVLESRFVLDTMARIVK